MKRIICVLMILFLLCGCTKIQNTDNNTDEYISGVWLSFSELNTLIVSNDFANRFDRVANNCKDFGITDMYVHVRAFCDVIYPSDYFPMLSALVGYDYDILEYMINSCHKRGIRIHAWINPYRVRTADDNISALNENNPAYVWLNDDNTENDGNVCICNGIYLNPASQEVRQLIINGVREILTKYSIDGIHFDDYFYPTTDENFDKQTYSDYCLKCKTPISVDDFRRANVNSLISGVYTAIKFINKDIVFSVSPSADIEKNKNQYYADISAWLDSGCVDLIIPQLYFGFDYPDDNFKFDKLFSRWCTLCDKKDVKLIIGLATYKINTDSKPDCEEWANGNDIINRQIKICRENENISGHAFFSYTSLEKYFIK